MLLFGLAVGALAGSYGSLLGRLETAKTLSDAKAAVGAEGLADRLGDELEELERTKGLDRFREQVRLRASAESALGETSSHAGAEAAKLLKNPAYRKLEANQSENWLGRALNRFHFPEDSGKSRAQPGIGFAAGLTNVVWVILAVLALTFLVLAIWFFSAQFSRRERKRGSILKEDEPARSSDEWLGLASGFEASGQLREAVRAHYLAALLRLDEAGILRFDRTETNWQHLGRLRAVGGRASALEGPTRQFDQAWFGFRPVSSEELAMFRHLPDEVVATSRERQV